MRVLNPLECEDSCCGHYASDEGSLYDRYEVDAYIESLRSRMADYQEALRFVAEGLWWDGNEPWEITRLESWAVAELARLDRVSEVK